MKNIISQFKNYLTEEYGKPLYRIPIDLAFGCPHRNQNGDGCIFCPEDGARARHLTRHLNLKEQVTKGIDYAERRYKANGNYIAYFQSYTNTNAPVETLKKYYEQVLSLAEFKMVIISTRPDCLPDDILEYLSELNNKYELWVELGVQTANDSTLKLINRGHDFSCTKSAVKELSALNIKTAAHIILGLPDENISDYRNTIYQLSTLPFSGIKIHNLLVLKKTPLAKMYGRIAIRPLNEYQYASAVIDVIRRTPANWPVMRINTDANPKDIIAPKWNLTKGQFLELIKTTMEENGFYQGELAGKKPSLEKNIDHELISYLKIKTEDGSYTFYNPTYKENYHTLAGAAAETQKKFIEPGKLKERLQTTGYRLQKPTTNNQQLTTINILDIGFGLGYNAIATIKEALQRNSSVKVTSLELNSTPLTLAQSIYKKDSLENNIISKMLEENKWEKDNNKIEILYGDARNTIQQIEGKFDIVFMDGFSTTKNPELWTFDFIKEIAKRLQTDGVIITYSSAFPVRGAFLRNKLFVGTTEPFGRKKGGTIASFSPKNIITPLAEKETNIILKSTAGIPYRDPTLNWSTKQILHQRSKTAKRLKSKGIPSWYKQKKIGGELLRNKE